MSRRDLTIYGPSEPEQVARGGQQSTNKLDKPTDANFGRWPATVTRDQRGEESHLLLTSAPDEIVQCAYRYSEKRCFFFFCGKRIVVSNRQSVC